MKVKDILAAKGSRVITVSKDISVFDAMKIFSGNRVGSLLVVDKDNNIEGIVGGRDVLMAVINNLEEIKTITIAEVMTTDLIVGTPDDDVDYIMTIMTENRIRHVPIIEGQELKGLVSIGDVVKSQMKATHAENKYLKDYIADKYPG